MADMLISLRSHASGDVIVISPSGWEWGKKEKPPLFAIIEFEDVAPSSLLRYTAINPSGSGASTIRKWNIDIASLPTTVMSQLEGTTGGRNAGRIIVGSGISKTEDITWNNFRSAVFDKEFSNTENDYNTILYTERDLAESGGKIRNKDRNDDRSGITSKGR